MKKVKLLPLKGLDIEQLGEIRFGDLREDVINKLGQPSEIEENTLYYDNLEISIDFDDNNKLEFFEIDGPNNLQIEVSLFNINPFTLPAKELIALLSEKNNGKVDDVDKPLAYNFLGLEIGLWREVSEADVKKEIKEARENGDYEPWMDDELEKSKYFWIIGLGCKGYYQY